MSSFGTKCIRLPKNLRFASQVQIPLTESLDESLKNCGSPTALKLKSTTLDNGMHVISTESDGGIARISVFVKAGSRYEDSSNLGITHVLQNAAFLTNKSKSSLGIVREMQHHGISLSITNSRDYFVYSGSGVKDCVDPLLSCIASSVSGPLFQHWELDDAYDLCLQDRDFMEAQPQMKLLDKLHSSAFRKGLGNSIYCEEHRVYSKDQLSDYINSNFVGEKISIVAIGCNHDELVKSVSVNFGSIPKGSPANVQKQKYFGGEQRIETDAKLTHAALAIEGAGHSSKDITTFGILQYLIGSSPFVKRGSNTISSRINRAVASSTENPFTACSLNISHSDSGIFGVYTITEPKDSSRALRAVVGELKAISEGKVKNEDFLRARNQLKAGILMTSENKEFLGEDIANQILSGGTYKSPEEICSNVDSVQLKDVQKAASAFMAKKCSYVVCGDCSSAPYYDELI